MPSTHMQIVHKDGTQLWPPSSEEMADYLGVFGEWMDKKLLKVEEERQAAAAAKEASAKPG